MSLRPVVFVCYSHKDKKETERLWDFLKPFQSRGIEFEVWSDEVIGAGAVWQKEIEKAIATADLALLVVSVDFLNSTFIQNFELPRIFARRDAGELNVFPLLLKDSSYEENPWLSGLQLVTRGGKPLYPCGENEDGALKAIARKVADAVTQVPSVVGGQKMLWVWVKQHWRALSLFVLVFSVWAVAHFFTLRRDTPEMSVPPFSVSLSSSPRYLSPNEIETLTFAIMNTDEKRGHDATLRLDSDNLMSCGVAGPDASNIWSKIFAVKERKTADLHVLCSWRWEQTFASPPKPAGLSMAMNVGETEIKSPLPLRIAPFPYIKTLWLCSLCLTVALWLYLFYEWWQKYYAVRHSGRRAFA